MKQELSKVNLALVRWAMRTHKGLRHKAAKARDWLGICAQTRPKLFAHWEMGIKPTV